MKNFQKNDCFRIPWDEEFGETTFVVYETYREHTGKQLLYANDINDEETVIGIYSEEVLPIKLQTTAKFGTIRHLNSIRKEPEWKIS